MKQKKPSCSINDFQLKVIAVKGFWLMAGLVLLIAPAKAQEGRISTLQAQSVAAAGSVSMDPVEDVIRRQLTAIRERNGDLAIALTTADFHEKYDDGRKFLGSLRMDHRPLYNHETYAFLKRNDVPGGFIQTVEIRDRYDRDTPVTVIFRVEEQPDGSWLIDSFSVIDDSGQTL